MKKEVIKTTAVMATSLAVITSAGKVHADNLETNNDTENKQVQTTQMLFLQALR